MERTNEDLVAAFARVLRAQRKQAGLSQEELAFRAGLSMSYVSLLEARNRQPTLTVIAAPAAELGLSLAGTAALIEAELGEGGRSRHGPGPPAVRAGGQTGVPQTPGALGDSAASPRHLLAVTSEPALRSAPRIVVVPGRRSGRAVVRGTRITVGDVLGWLASGMSVEEVLADFPELTREDVAACLAHAAALAGMTDEAGGAGQAA